MTLVYFCIDDGEQLRYALRSLATCKGVDRLLVVGTIPNWHKGESLPMLRMSDKSLSDVTAKMLATIKHLNFDPFVWMNDDFICSKIDFANLPLMGRAESIQDVALSGSGGWYNSLQLTADWLKNNDAPNRCFEAHQPFRVDNPRLLQLVLLAAPSHHFKTIYGNLIGSEVIEVANCKLKEGTSEKEFADYLKKHSFVSVSEKTFNADAGAWLKKTFNKKSKYEL